MKKLSAIAVILFSTFAAMGQSSTSQSNNNGAKFKGGVMINPFVSWGQPNTDDPTKNKVESTVPSLGFGYGLVGDFFFNNNYGINANLRVTSFNTQFRYTPEIKSSYAIDRTLKLQYVELPITLKMRTNEIGYFRYFAQFGIMPAVKLAARGDIDTLLNNTVMHSVKDLNITNDVNIFMLYSVIGLGAEYNLGGSTSIIGSITWNNGFTNVWNKNTDDRSVNPPVYSNFNSPVSNIALNLGVEF